MKQILDKFFALIILCLLSFPIIHAQQIPTTCQVLAVPAIVHAEGLAERMGDIDLQCSGTPGVTVTVNLGVTLAVPISNTVNASNYAVGPSVSINTGTGSLPSGVSGLISGQSIAFNGVSFTFPSSGTLSLVIDDIRGDVNSINPQQGQQIMAYLNSTIPISNGPVTVATAGIGLLASIMDSGVVCTGSPTPATVSVTNLISARTAEQTTRVTEGFASSFQPKDATSTQGTRFILTYSNVPEGVNIYVPDAVAGSGTVVPSSGGDLGTAPAVGQYLQGSQTLLLVRVLNTDATGAGGTWATLPAPNGSGVLVLEGANPVPLTSGSGFAVYEVAAANPGAIESAQIANWFAVPPDTQGGPVSATVTFAPTSTVGTPSETLPVPRFVAVQPPLDCGSVGECNASYFPQLSVTAPASMSATAVAGGKRVGVANITIQNSRGGILDWSITPTYGPGAGNWLFFTQSYGINNAMVQIVADPSSLAAGTYTATLVISGGPIAGSQSFPVTFAVNAAAEPPAITVNAVTDAADLRTAPVVAGELATIWGSNLGGTNVSATLNSIPANLLYTGVQQINLRIPPSLAGQSSAQLVVVADGVSSAPFTVQLASAAPAIFTPGVLNQDYTINSPSRPAAPGSVLQIFGTGMPDSGGVFSVSIQNQSGLIPLYAGAAPGLPGMQQVNVAIPSNLQGTTANLIICVAGSGSQQSCSQPEAIALQ